MFPYLMTMAVELNPDGPKIWFDRVGSTITELRPVKVEAFSDKSIRAVGLARVEREVLITVGCLDSGLL